MRIGEVSIVGGPHLHVLSQELLFFPHCKGIFSLYHASMSLIKGLTQQRWLSVDQLGLSGSMGDEWNKYVKDL